MKKLLFTAAMGLIALDMAAQESKDTLQQE